MNTDSRYIKLYRGDTFLGNFEVLSHENGRLQLKRFTQEGYETKTTIDIDVRKFRIKRLEKTVSCGILFRYNGKNLIVEQVGGDYSLPKGKIEPGETEKEAAVRELQEEIGVEFPKELLPDEFHTITWFKENKFKVYNYFVVDLTDEQFQEYFNGLEIIPNKDLQDYEIKWAGFVNYDELTELLAPRFLGILSHI